MALLSLLPATSRVAGTLIVRPDGALRRGEKVMRKAIALSALASVLLLAATGLSAQAERPIPCSVSGTTPGGHVVHANVPAPVVQDFVDRWIHAGFTDVTFDCR